MILAWLGIVYILFLAKHNPFYASVLPSLFRVLLQWEFRWPEAFFLNTLFSLVSLTIHTWIGILFLRLFIRFPIGLEIAAGLFTGIGLSTFVLEFFAIFFLLNRVTILLTLFLFIVLLTLAQKKISKQPIVWTPASYATETRFQTLLFRCAWGTLAIITLLNFYHSLFFPVSYWDALILYIHYGKMTYEQGGFPILVCLQVGLGLGANYPHLYPLHQAVTATLFDHWSDLYGQVLMPLAHLGSLIALYYLILHQFQNRLIAILPLLAFRSIPYVTSYYIWASDYALVMAYTCLFALFLYIYLKNNDLWLLHPLLCVAAIFPHINYLGWIVWPCVAAAVLWPGETSRFINKTLFSWKSWGMLLFWFLLAATWNIRNWIVTGNPVYAFFPEIFGGKNINLEVLASCNQEWTYHGYGASQLGNTLREKILNSIHVFIMDWRFTPLLAGLLLPSFFLGWRRKQPFYLILGLLIFLYFLYQYVISGLYWYHTLAVMPLLAIFTGRFLAAIPNLYLLNFFAVLLLFIGVAPGITFSIMGSKHADPNLSHFRHPGIKPENFYRFVYPEEAPIWRYINLNLEQNSTILTHDNRYHVYRDDIQIIHLDDCDLVPMYGRPYPEIHQELLKRSVDYYLRLGDHEESHPILKKLGHNEYLNNPNYFKRQMESGSIILYELVE